MPFKSENSSSQDFKHATRLLIGTGLAITLAPMAAFAQIPPTIPLTSANSVQPVLAYVNPYKFENSGTFSEMRIAANPNGYTPFTVDTHSGFKTYDLTVGQVTTATQESNFANLVQVDVRVGTLPENITGQTGWALVIWADSDPTVHAPIARVNSTTCFQNYGGTNKPCLDNTFAETGAEDLAGAVYVTANQTYRIGFYLKDLCATEFGSAGIDGCNTTTVDPPGPFKLNFSVMRYSGNGSTRPVVASTDVKASLRIAIETEPLTNLPLSTVTTTCAISDETKMYTPLDQAILVNPNLLTMTGLPTGAEFPDAIVAIASRAPLVTNETFGNAGVNDVVGAISRGGIGYGRVSGFENTTTGADNQYFAGFALRNRAGLVGDFSCLIDPVETAEVEGFLTGDHCFIATAAHGSKDAPPVKILRHFRDRVLRANRVGVSFVNLYYRLSPPLARFIAAHPLLKIPVLGLLAPVQFYAWMALQLSELPSLLPEAQGAEVDESLSNQPYIDRLKARHPENYADDEEGSLIEKVQADIRKREGERGPETSYTAGIQAKLLAEESKKNAAEEQSYTESERAKMKPNPEDNESSIGNVMTGKSDLKMKRPGKISAAFGFRVATALDRNYTTAAGASARSFSSMYGTGWKPEFQFFGEYQPFHSEIFGNFGIVGTTGVGIFNGTGKFKIPIQYSNGSAVGANSGVLYYFLKIPVLLGLNYRFNLFQVIKPYVQVSPGFMGYQELRNDTKGAFSGLSRVVQLQGGVNIPLDWVSSDNAWSMYTSYGVKKFYLTIDYTMLRNLGSPVDFASSGINVGFTAEI